MQPLRVRLLAVLLPVTALLAVPTAAHADRVATHDAAGDADSIFMDAEEEVFTPAPEHRSVDITRTVVTHRAHRIGVAVTYQELDDAFAHYQHIRLRTSGQRFDIMVERLGGPAFPVMTRREREDWVGCAGMRASVDRAAERITVSVPTRCVGSPRWVQVGVVSYGYDRRAAASDPAARTFFLDDAHRTGGFSDDDPRLGPKVPRG